MQQQALDGSQVRLAELIAALSLATDLGMNIPLEQALCTCIISVPLGEALGLDDEQLREAYYLGLLYFIGCNADTHLLAGLQDEPAWETVLASESGRPVLLKAQ
jgi:hypothetical protein